MLSVMGTATVTNTATPTVPDTDTDACRRWTGRSAGAGGER